MLMLIEEPHMAEFGEWSRKGAALSEVTAEKEYGVTRNFIVKGIQAGKLEYRDGAVWGNPYLRVLSWTLANFRGPETAISQAFRMLPRIFLRFWARPGPIK